MKTNPDKLAFACAAENGHQPGMTYREWLIGQLAAGIGSHNEFAFDTRTSNAIVKFTDILIKQINIREDGEEKENE